MRCPSHSLLTDSLGARYGGNPYYYNLNYDGFPNAIASLYVVMIQNNWNVAADGPIQVTNGNFRWFFVIFTVSVAFVMINVLVGAIIDALSAVWFRSSRDPCVLSDLCVACRCVTTKP